MNVICSGNPPTADVRSQTVPSSSDLYRSEAATAALCTCWPGFLAAAPAQQTNKCIHFAQTFALAISIYLPVARSEPEPEPQPSPAQPSPARSRARDPSSFSSQHSLDRSRSLLRVVTLLLVDLLTPYATADLTVPSWTAPHRVLLIRT